jgi:hypothetical protein
MSSEEEDGVIDLLLEADVLELRMSPLTALTIFLELEDGLEAPDMRNSDFSSP